MKQGSQAEGNTLCDTQQLAFDARKDFATRKEGEKNTSADRFKR